MKALGPAMATLVLMMAFLLSAGCSGSPAPATPVTTSPPATGSATPAQTVSFTLSGSYLSRPTPYSFTSEKDVYYEEFRATNDPWGIEFTVNPTNEDPQYTWFKMTLTQLDTGKTDTFGYGRDFSLEKHQLIPMYNSGPYKIEMRGNRVSVKVNIAKRNP